MAIYQSTQQKIDHLFDNPHHARSNIENSNALMVPISTATKQTINRSEIAKKAAKTRLLNDPDAFKKMGAKGGKARHVHENEEV